MINKLIDERTKNSIMIFLFLIALFVLIYGSFRLGEVYICKKSDMELLVEPEIKCVTQEEIQELNKTWDYGKKNYSYTLRI